MSIDGVWGFVFAGQAGIGVGAVVVKNGKFHGCDSGGVRYEGIATEDKGTGEITLDFDQHVPPGAWIVSGSSPMDVAHTRHQSFKVPPQFGELQPLALPVRPGNVTVIFVRHSQEYAAYADGFDIVPRRSAAGFQTVVSEPKRR